MKWLYAILALIAATIYAFNTTMINYLVVAVMWAGEFRCQVLKERIDIVNDSLNYWIKNSK